MRQLIIDITYLAHWQGRLTGIPRVVDELTRRYMTRDQPPLFVVWDNMGKEFYHVDVAKTLQNRGTSLHYLSHDVKKVQAGRITRKAVHAMQKLKADYRAPIPGRLINIALRGGSSAYRRLEVSSGDVLLIAMGEWHNQYYIDTVIGYAKSGVSLVQISYDVLPLVQPQYSGHSTNTMENYNRLVMPHCELVLSISENTKKDLTYWLREQGLNVPRIEVFRLGDDFQAISAVRPVHPMFQDMNTPHDKRFILCVGTVEARKNHTLLYYAYKLAKSRGVSLPPLVVVGRKGWLADDIYEIITTDPDTKNQILIMSDIGDPELSWLYRHASFSIYPSFYEGWGLPVAESALYGLPCACSNTSSIPEIAGDLMTYFSPSSTEECLAAIRLLLQPRELSKAQKRLKNYVPTKWEQTFQQVDKYLREV